MEQQSQIDYRAQLTETQKRIVAEHESRDQTVTVEYVEPKSGNAIMKIVAKAHARRMVYGRNGHIRHTENISFGDVIVRSSIPVSSDDPKVLAIFG